MRTIAIRYGFLLCASLIVFFLFMHFLGLSRNYNLRILNGIIHIGFMYAAIKLYTQRYPSEAKNYLSSVGLGMWMATIGVAGFAAFMTIFLFSQPEFMQQLQEEAPLGQYLNPFVAGAAVLMEGLSVSIVASYLITRIVLSSKSQPA